MEYWIGRPYLTAINQLKVIITKYQIFKISFSTWRSKVTSNVSSITTETQKCNAYILSEVHLIKSAFKDM